MNTLEITIITLVYLVVLLTAYRLGHIKGQVKVMKDMQKELDQIKNLKNVSKIISKFGGKNE